MADIITVQTIADVAGVKHVAKMTNLSEKLKIKILLQST